jgi:hypothetical protein
VATSRTVILVASVVYTGIALTSDHPQRHFTPPWNIEDNGTCFIIRDNSRQALSCVYYEEPGRRTAAGLLTRRRDAPHRHQHREAAGAVALNGKIKAPRYAAGL